MGGSVVRHTEPDCFPYSVLVAPVPCTTQFIGLCLVQLDADVPSIVAVHFVQRVHHHTFQANLRGKTFQATLCRKNHSQTLCTFLPHQAFKVRAGFRTCCCEVPLI